MLNQLPDGTIAENIEYHLLSDDLPEDFVLRKKLHDKRLEIVLAQCQFERSDETYERNCLYCRDIITKTRTAFIEHLFNKHFLQLGKAENLVFIDELIEEIQNRLDKLICIYCEKTFKDRATLKEHMRKKGHKRINPDNKLYDKYFLINYKKEMKSSGACSDNSKYVRAMVNEQSRTFDSPDNSDEDWGDWDGNWETENIACLYCTHTETNFQTLKQHMQQTHGVDIDTELANLSFYEKVKVINYVRRQMYTHKCVTCNMEHSGIDDLQQHLSTAKHYGIGDKTSWDKPEFFFPTYEDDAVLCYLEDTASDSTMSDSPVHQTVDEENVVVHFEDVIQKANVNPEAEALSKELMKF